MSTKKVKKSDYTPRPDIDEQVSPEVLRRLEVVSRVMGGVTTVTDAAEELGLSRNRFQSIYHRALGAMMAELEPKAGGRPSKDARMAALEKENEQLKKDVRSLTLHLDVSRKATLNLAEMVRQQHSIGRARSPRTKSPNAAETTSDASDDDDGARVILCEARRMMDAGVPEELAAATVGAAPSTLRRWRVRHRAGKIIVRKRGPRRDVVEPSVAFAKAKSLVEDVRGFIGADALAKATGLSRRVAAIVKALTCTAMERARKEACRRVVVTSPGIVRGFDQVYVDTLSGWRFALVSADAAIPFRTSTHVADRYTSDEVAAALELDYERNGAPLVERLDRAAVHRTPQVLDVMRSHRVLALHGPPRCPRYYGQLERQNREHRAWLDDVEIRDDTHLAAEIAEMTRCLNELIPRRSLGWCTPTAKWNERPVIEIDRDAFIDEVQDHSQRIGARLSEKELLLGYDQRFAIEHALARHGFLRVTDEGRC